MSTKAKKCSKFCHYFNLGCGFCVEKIGLEGIKQALIYQQCSLGHSACNWRQTNTFSKSYLGTRFFTIVVGWLELFKLRSDFPYIWQSHIIIWKLCQIATCARSPLAYLYVDTVDGQTDRQIEIHSFSALFSKVKVLIADLPHTYVSVCVTPT